MSRRTIWLLISLMSVALIGISAFQVYWINNVIRLSQERFEKDALASLKIVANRLERNEMVNVATNSFAFFGTSSDEEQNDIRFEEEVLVTSTHDTLQGKFWYRSNTNNRVKVIIRQDSVGEIKEFVNDREMATIEVNVITDDTSSTEQVAKRINSKQRVLTKVVEEMMLHEVRQANRVHPVVLDSLLQQEFKNHGINIKYEFGIYDTQHNEFQVVRAENKEELKETSLRASLFPNDIINNGLSLIVNFPGKNRFLLEKVWLSLLVSLLFILIIISVFAYVVYKLIHQKKLADLKNDFINNMTHEFKTPIATVTLATEALSENTVQANSKMRDRYIEVIREESRRLSMQVEKVLQMASIEQKELTLNKKPAGINEMVSSAVERARFQVEEKKGQISANLSDDNIEVFADENHFSNAIFNLLDNAIKYSSSAPVIGLKVELSNRTLKISVSDQGIGMSKDQQRQIFDKFYRVPTGNLHDVKGFGLGLNYVKYIVEAHHGEITLTSTPGEGSTFTIVLDLDKHGI